MKASHKGWFLFCPVFVDMVTDPESPGIWARWEILEPLLSLAHWCQQSMNGFLSSIDPFYEPSFAFFLTGEV